MQHQPSSVTEKRERPETIYTTVIMQNLISDEEAFHYYFFKFLYFLVLSIVFLLKHKYLIYTAITFLLLNHLQKISGHNITYTGI